MTELPKDLKEHQLDPEWKETMIERINDSLSHYETFLVLDFSPLTLTLNNNRKGALDDPRGWEELPDITYDFIVKILFTKVGFNPKTSDMVTIYNLPSPLQDQDNTSLLTQVRVYETNRSGEGMFLHQILSPGRRPEYMVASQDYQP